jgi:hypothetical protein
MVPSALAFVVDSHMIMALGARGYRDQIVAWT